MKILEKNWKVIIGILFVLVVIAHLIFYVKIGDDIFFENIPMNELFSWLSSRYDAWSSRIFIELVLVVSLKLPVIIWAVINSFMLFLLAYSISFLFTKNGVREKFVVLFGVFLFPMSLMSEAGWYATTINYIWPLALGVFSCIPIKKVLTQKSIKPWMYPIYVVSLLFACNHELMCAILFVFYGLFLRYCFWKKKNSKFLIFQWIFTLISLIFILTCPGNSVRNASEIINWYPEYANFEFIHKIVLGILSTTSILILDYKLPFFMLLILLPYTLRNHKNYWVKLLSFFPLGIFGMLQVLPQFFPKFEVLVTQLTVYMNQIPYVHMHSVYLYLFFVMAFVLFGSIVVCLYFIFQDEDSYSRYLFPLIFLAGLTTRFLMGFSPTIYASGQRTFLFFQFAMIICDIVLFFKNAALKNSKTVFVILMVLSLLQILSVILI